MSHRGCELRLMMDLSSIRVHREEKKLQKKKKHAQIICDLQFSPLLASGICAHGFLAQVLE